MAQDQGKQPNQVRKFSLLEYFYVLLLSIEKFSEKKNVFSYFKELGAQHHLGRSKYKKLTSDSKMPTYTYSFQQVVAEAKDYELIAENNNNFKLSKNGKNLLAEYNKGGLSGFNDLLLTFMERIYNNVFKEIISFMYNNNKKKGGLLIFPYASPSELGISPKQLRSRDSILHYCERLMDIIKESANKHLEIPIEKNLNDAKNRLIEKLENENLLPKNDDKEVSPTKYWHIIDKFKPFWMHFFLEGVYKFKHSMSSFENWIHRGKQIGIIHIAESYPGFKGRIVYPTSVISKKRDLKDFDELKIPKLEIISA